MSISLLVAAIGCLGAAAGTGLLIAKCLRAPNGALVAWTVALFGLAASLAAQTVGHALSFGPVAFRATEIGAGVIAPLALAVGLTEVAGRSLPVRFAARLVLPAFAFVSVVILASDPLSVAVFSKAWPPPTLLPDHPEQDPEVRTGAGHRRRRAGRAGIAVRRPAARRPGGTRCRQWPAPRLPRWLSRPARPRGAEQRDLAAVRSLVAPLCVAAVVLTWFAAGGPPACHLELLRQHEGAEDPDEWALQRSWTAGRRPGSSSRWARPTIVRESLPRPVASARRPRLRGAAGYDAQAPPRRPGRHGVPGQLPNEAGTWTTGGCTGTKRLRGLNPGTPATWRPRTSPRNWTTDRGTGMGPATWRSGPPGQRDIRRSRLRRVPAAARRR